MCLAGPDLIDLESNNMEILDRSRLQNIDIVLENQKWEVRKVRRRTSKPEVFIER